MYIHSPYIAWIVIPPHCIKQLFPAINFIWMKHKKLKARIKAIIRRSSVTETKEPPKVYSYNGLRIDIESRRGYINDQEVNLTAKEFDLLELLMLHPNKVYGREELLNTVWGYDYPGDVRTVDVHIRRLREKIEESPSNPVFIHTKWGVGYYFQK